jgi:hypothetical protein
MHVELSTPVVTVCVGYTVLVTSSVRQVMQCLLID